MFVAVVKADKGLATWFVFLLEQTIWTARLREHQNEVSSCRCTSSSVPSARTSSRSCRAAARLHLPFARPVERKGASRSSSPIRASTSREAVGTRTVMVQVEGVIPRQLRPAKRAPRARSLLPRRPRLNRRQRRHLLARRVRGARRPPARRVVTRRRPESEDLGRGVVPASTVYRLCE